MKCNNFKSLDRPFEILGLKGRWVTMFLVGVGGSVVLGIVVGSMMGTAFAVASILFGVLAVFLVCKTRQSVVSERKFIKLRGAEKAEAEVIRRNNLNRILRPAERCEDQAWREVIGKALATVAVIEVPEQTPDLQTSEPAAIAEETSSAEDVTMQTETETESEPELNGISID